MLLKTTQIFVLGLLATPNISSAAPTKEPLVVYSARAEHLIKPLFEAYTKDTGVPINFISDKEGVLIEKLKAEAKNSTADILLTVDAGNLWYAKEQGVLQKIDSQVLNKNIPEHLRDPAQHWYALSVRARTLIYNTQKIKASDLSTYEDLADPKWKGRLCLRTSKKVYNQSLVATLISQLGEKRAEEVVRGWVANLATEVFPDDTKMMEAIAAGQCDVGIGNTYYYGRLMREKPKLKIALFWPNQEDRGVHVNVSGAGITRYAKNKAEALKFLEWLSSEKAQNLFADANIEYPANPQIKASKEVAAWGSFKQDVINVSTAGKLQRSAVRLMDRVGYK
jgi:iron(III) transport system substrate-binding protein